MRLEDGCRFVLIPNDITIGVSSWSTRAQGGGHGALSNTLGLVVDRIVRMPCLCHQYEQLKAQAQLEYKIVTPDGKLRIVNKCQNQDLFFALRGGML